MSAKPEAIASSLPGVTSYLLRTELLTSPYLGFHGQFSTSYHYLHSPLMSWNWNVLPILCWITSLTPFAPFFSSWNSIIEPYIFVVPKQLWLLGLLNYQVSYLLHSILFPPAYLSGGLTPLSEKGRENHKWYNHFWVSLVWSYTRGFRSY